MNFTVTFMVPQLSSDLKLQEQRERKRKKKKKNWPHWLFLPTVWWRYLHTSRENCGSRDSYSVLDLCFMFKAKWLLHCMPVLSALSSKCSPQTAVTDILWIMHFYNTFLSSAAEESNIGTRNFFLLYKIALEKVCAKKNLYVNKVVFLVLFTLFSA